MTATITAPGVYELPEAEYHAHPALSSSGARKLLPPSCPALFRYEQDNPPPTRRVFEIGHAAHALALGTGPELVKIDADEWRTNAIKAEVAEVRARGAVPLKPDQFEHIHAMAKALRANPIASALLYDNGGQSESSLFWTDERTGVDRRARFDLLPERSDGRMIIPDYKTADSAAEEKFVKSIVNYGYHQQGSWYLDGAEACGFGDDAQFVYIVQEKSAPYLVNVIGLPEIFIRIGRILNRRAIDLFAECTRTDTWPGYSSDVVYPSPPFWYVNQFEEQL